MGVLSIPMRPLECAISGTVHRALIIQMVKQIVQLFKERYTET
jgi:hypothetical protein